MSWSVSGGRSSGPFTISAPNLSFGSSGFGIPSSKAHLPMWARFRALAHRQVSGQLYEPTSGGLIELVRFPVAFRPPALGFLGILYPPADISLPHSRPTGQGPAHDGVTTFHTHETRPGWGAPSTPGRRCSPGRYDLSGRRLPLPSDQSCPPATTFHRRGLRDEASSGVHSRSPVRSSPHL